MSRTTAPSALPFADAAALRSALGYRGPERRAGLESVLWRLLVAVLDEVDYGLVLLAADGRVLHANHAAVDDLGSERPLQIREQQLKAARRAEQDALEHALQRATMHGERQLLKVGEGGTHALNLSIVPLPASLASEAIGHVTLVTLARGQMAGQLSVAAFARRHALSARETEVLQCLCDGHAATAIAERLGMSQATARSHIHHIKAKTGCASTMALVQELAVLPPLQGLLKASL